MCRDFFNPRDQILGHCCAGKGGSSHDVVYMLSNAGEEQRSLSCGVSTAYNDDLSIPTKHAFHRRRGII